MTPADDDFQSVAFTVHVFVPMGEDEQDEFLEKISDIALAHFGADETEVRYMVTAGNIDGSGHTDWVEFLQSLANHYGANKVLIPKATDAS